MVGRAQLSVFFYSESFLGNSNYLALASERSIHIFSQYFSVSVLDAAGNFLAAAANLSFNAFKTVMEIDTMGTFNCSKVVYEKWMRVGHIYIRESLVN